MRDKSRNKSGRPVYFRLDMLEMLIHYSVKCGAPCEAYLIQSWCNKWHASDKSEKKEVTSQNSTSRVELIGSYWTNSIHRRLFDLTAFIVDNI